ncbi:DUF5304 family protein [Streptacidiphilus sp. P02-A3a]|uniref:DUF5304 family protein n=1 Tax=Streptacidiphilus sp. P02-A3a TaxID=2704468 RepID=UPI0015F8819D|nr:DUF5304 family protein [Streptacidiphilus sp. P02-A3a]QMU68527.1 DUF5304 domain-containing protein [Streptacidiphilus sp. P02-A3a]
MTTADDRHDEDVWAQAVAEDAKQQHQEQANRARPQGEDGEAAGAEPKSATGDLFGPELGPLVEEVRKFAAAVGGRVDEAASALGAGDGMRGLQQLAAPLRGKHPEVYGHLIAAGGELLAAYRAAVTASERRWSAAKPSGSEQIDLD